MNKRKSTHGGKRSGAGRRPAGNEPHVRREQFTLRLQKAHIKWVRDQAAKKNTENCLIVEEAIDTQQRVDKLPSKDKQNLLPPKRARRKKKTPAVLKPPQEHLARSNRKQNAK